MSKSVLLTEYVQSSTHKVDKEAGVIRGVKILGLESSNGRRYSPEAAKRAAGLYEGRVVNCDHPAKANDSRRVHDRFGRTINVQFREDGLYGDLDYLRSHPLAGPISEAAERMPDIFGLSHVARGKERRENGNVIIEDIESVISVDIVADPATVKGLFESKEHQEQAMPDEATGTPPPPASPEEAFISMAIAVLRDTSLDKAAKLKKLKMILDSEEKLMAKAEEPAAEEIPAEESKKPVTPNLIEQENKALKLCLASGLTPSETLLKALVKLEESEMKTLIEEQKPTKPNSKPKSAPPSAFLEQRNNDALPTDREALKRACFN